MKGMKLRPTQTDRLYLRHRYASRNTRSFLISRPIGPYRWCARRSSWRPYHGPSPAMLSNIIFYSLVQFESDGSALHVQLLCRSRTGQVSVSRLLEIMHIKVIRRCRSSTWRTLIAIWIGFSSRWLQGYIPYRSGRFDAMLYLRPDYPTSSYAIEDGKYKRSVVSRHRSYL